MADLEKSLKFLRDFGVKGKTKGKKSWNLDPEELGGKDFGIKGRTRGKGSWEDNPKPLKVTKKEVSVETTPDSTSVGNIGSVDRTADVINSSPDMSRTNIPAPVIEASSSAKPFQNTDPSKVIDKDRTTWIDPQLQARRSLGFKKGGSVKVSKASKRGDGCAVRGKTKGRMV